MKKIALSLSFLLCAFFSFAQFPNRFELSNAKTIYVPLGAVAPGQSLMIPVIDTLNNLATPYRGALTVRPQDSLLYMSDGVNWHPFVSSTNGWIVDSIYVERPIAVKIGTSGVSLGKQVIYFLKESGLIAGGIPVSTGCRTLLMPPSIYNINFNQYTSLATNLTIDTSHATLNRTDRIVGDTFGVISVIKGTPSSLGLAPTYNPSSQFSLALIPIPAASACTPPSSSIKVVYDENLGVAGGEYDVTTVGAIASDPDNTDNPYHLNKALFISTYVDSSQQVFTNTGLQDTVTSTSVLVLPEYLNVRQVNPVQVEFFLNTTSVSNNTVINSYFNALDTGQYQVAAIPFTAFGFSSNIFNKIVFTFRGWDTSGAAGLYFDWIQIQKGITFTPIGTVYTASQGLALVVNDFQIGASTAGLAPTFTTNRFINAQTFKLQLTGTTGSRLQLQSSSTGTGLSVFTATGTGISSNTTGGIAIAAGVVGTGAALSIGNNHATGGTSSMLEMLGTYDTANTVVPAILIRRISTAIAQIGMGTSIDFRLGGASGGSIQDAGRIINKWTTVAGSQFGAQMEFWNAKAATRRRNMAITEDGGITLDQYASGGFYVNDSTNNKPLVVNTSGVVSQGNWSGGGGGGADMVFNEEFTGSTSLTLTLSQTYITGTIRLFKNGARLNLADFTEAAATTITLNVARLSGDIFTVDFNY